MQKYNLMKKILTLCLSLLTLLTLQATTTSPEAATAPHNHRLWYTQPASIWEETLPLGNGRLGLMPDGHPQCERLVLNEISLWSGCEADYRNPQAADSLPRIRQLLFEGRNREAQELMYRSFVPRIPETGSSYGTYQMLGYLTLQFNGVTGETSHYERSLSLREGIARTSFLQEGVRHEREYFASRADDVCYVHLKVSRPGALHFTAQLSRPERATVSTDSQSLLLQGQLDSGHPDKPGMRFRAALRLVSKGGTARLDANRGISLQGADEAWLILSAATDYAAEGTTFPGSRYEAFCDSLLSQAAQPQRLSDAADRHTKAHRSYYDRVSLCLPASPDDALPTDQRLLRFAQQPAPGLAALYYNYGRYLFFSSTRSGSLPPNLQGLWANTLQTPWNGDYHTNINIQMNYWPMEPTALGDLHDPLLTLVERLLPSGGESARAFYGPQAEGWVLHMMTNIWNYTAPGDHPSWGATNTSGAWLCQHLWHHYLYTGDQAYLQRIYPILKGAAQFFASTLVEEPQHGWLVTAPTSSPENAFYVGNDPTPVSVCMGPTMDVQILTELFTHTATAARLLGRDVQWAEQLEALLKRFPPMQISPEGYLQEWLEDYREQDVHHRHVSHLYGLHPSNLISPQRTPELAEACRKTLNRRGDAGTGWSRAWKINFWARLGDGDRAWSLFHSLLQPAKFARGGTKHGSGTFPNLFCSHQPFQIDGNFGGTAGISEMLLQASDGVIRFLPALPSSWREGSFSGWRVPQAEISLQWRDGRAVRATVRRLYGEGNLAIALPAGCSRVEILTPAGRRIEQAPQWELSLQVGQEAELLFQTD